MNKESAAELFSAYASHAARTFHFKACGVFNNLANIVLSNKIFTLTLFFTKVQQLRKMSSTKGRKTDLIWGSIDSYH